MESRLSLLREATLNLPALSRPFRPGNGHLLPSSPMSSLTMFVLGCGTMGIAVTSGESPLFTELP
jgi:hypothetical protein